MNPPKRILIVDENREGLRGLADLLTVIEGNWKVDTADSGAQALQKLQIQPFDVVVADYHMPRMTGEELLKKIAVDHPQSVRIILSGFFDAKATSRMMQTAHQYLCKPCNPVEVTEAISRALFLRDLLANQDLQRLVTQMQALPMLPALYSELMNELQGKDPSLARITSIVSRDLGLTSKMLQLVNSPFFGLAERVSDMGQAVMHLGIEPIKALVLALQVFAVFERLRSEEASMRPLWNHSWAGARLAQRIAREENLELYAVNQSFTAGLLHDVGKLIFITGTPKQFATAMSLHRDSRVPLWKAEQEVFGCTHAEVGAYLLGLWGLPTPVVETVAMHHRPGACSTHSISVLTMVHVADALEREAEPSARIAPVTELDDKYIQQLELLDRVAAWRVLREDLVNEAG